MSQAIHTRREFLKAMSLGAAAVGVPRSWASATDARKPNVILVMTDDQGYGDLACHGNRWIKTPNLDKLHGECVRLTDFHVSPKCSPTRASLLTGRHCRAVGVQGTNNSVNLLARGVTTMADVFADNGYRTGIFGKWHLGDNYPYRPQDRGFQEAVVHGDGAITTTGDVDWGNDYFDDVYWHNGKRRRYTGYCTDIWFTEAIKFMTAAKDRPFFCYIPTNAPHGPLIVPPRYSKPYEGVRGVPSAEFYGMITNIDENVGRLRGFLEQSGLTDNTILIFMTDNGTSRGVRRRKGKGGPTAAGFNAGMRGNKGSPYDGGHRVPLFIRWPAGGLVGGRDVDRLAAHLDVLPTLIELCGLRPPKGATFDGKSLKAMLFGKQANWPDRTIVESFKGAVMTQRWRLVGDELYDIVADPAQRNDVASKHPQVAAGLRQARRDAERTWDTRKQRPIIGSDHENPARFTVDQYVGLSKTWQRDTVRLGRPVNGPLLVEVRRAGTYEFRLRRWPKEVDAAIRGATKGGKALPIVKARLKVGDFDKTVPVAGQTKEITFRVALTPGDVSIQTWFVREDGSSSGAYYLYIKRA